MRAVRLLANGSGELSDRQVFASDDKGPAKGGPIARMEGHGPVTTTWVRELIAHIAGKVKVTPVIDLNDQIAVDAYEIPNRLREAVHLIHPGDVFPYATNTSRSVDLDHQLPYSEGGKTSTTNLGPLTRTHHRIKTHGHWKARQPFPPGSSYGEIPTGPTTSLTPLVADDSPPPRPDCRPVTGESQAKSSAVQIQR